MAQNREGSINLFGAVQAKTEDGIVAHADGIAVGYDANGKPNKTLEELLQEGVGGSGTSIPTLEIEWSDYYTTTDTIGWTQTISEELFTKINEANALILTIITGSGNNVISFFHAIEKDSQNIFLESTQEYVYNHAMINYDGTSYILTISRDFTSNLKIEYVEELPSPTISVEGTEVPSSGMVGKVYFNTKLSIEETNAILETLEYTTNTDAFPTPFTGVFVSQTMSVGLIMSRFDNDGAFAKPTLSINYFDVDNNISTTIYQSSIEEEGGDKGWLVSSLDINLENALEMVTAYLGMTIQNDKLKNLISTTPFEEPNPEIDLTKLYRTAIIEVVGWEGTTVPNTGIVEKVYFNTELSDSKVEEILSQLTYPENGNEFILVAGDLNNPTLGIAIMGNSTEGIYAIGTLSGGVYWANQKAVASGGSQFGITTAGWQEFDNPIVVNNEVISSDATDNAAATVVVGTQNDKISSLFSTTSFIPVYGEPKGFKYHQLVNGVWKELGSGGNSENAPVVIEIGGLSIGLSGETDWEQLTPQINDDIWNKMISNKIVMLVLNFSLSDVVSYTTTMIKTMQTTGLYTNEIAEVLFTTVNGQHSSVTLSIKKENGVYSVTEQKSSSITDITANQTSTKITIQKREMNTFTDVINIPIVNEGSQIASGNTNLVNSKAIYEFVDEYMKANYGNGNEEKF